MTRKDIMNRLRDIRKLQGTTQGALSEAAGYNRVHLLRCEKGFRSPRLDMACDLAEALGYELVLVRKEKAA